MLRRAGPVAVFSAFWMAGGGVAGERGGAPPSVASSEEGPLFRVERLASNPIIHPEMPGIEAERGYHNINGPSLIRVPDWVSNPLGKYYLYFAHHQGTYIRLAYADRLEGPWMIYESVVLHLDDTPGRGHVASPDVHVDPDERRIRMYFHQPVPEDSGLSGQRTWVALSEDGLNFRVRDEVLGLSYFRVFEHGGWYYALAKYFNQDGIIHRSRDGLTDFEEGPHYLPGVRHTAVWKDGETLYVFYSLVGIEGVPEHLYVSKVDLSKDWMDWEFSEPQSLLRPEKEWEGAHLPIQTSRYGAARGPVHELRDPAIYEEDGQLYLLYSVQGEYGIAIAKLHRRR